MAEYEEGALLPIPADSVDNIEDLAHNDTVTDADVTIVMEQVKRAMLISKKAHDRLWRAIHKIHPGLDDYQCSYNREKKHIKIKGKRGEGDNPFDNMDGIPNIGEMIETLMNR